MEETVHSNQLKKAKKTSRNKDYVIIFLAICLLMSLFLAVKNANRERVIITPPVTRETFWVDSNDASPEYLREMSTYFIYTVNNITPSTIDYNYKLFMDKVLPSQQGVLQSVLNKQSQRVKRNNLATMFNIKGFKIDAASNKVVITGQMDSLIGNKLVSSQEKVFRIGYQLVNGKLYVSEFGEVNSNNPWGDFVNENQ